MTESRDSHDCPTLLNSSASPLTYGSDPSSLKPWSVPLKRGRPSLQPSPPSWVRLSPLGTVRASPNAELSTCHHFQTTPSSSSPPSTAGGSSRQSVRSSSSVDSISFIANSTQTLKRGAFSCGSLSTSIRRRAPDRTSKRDLRRSRVHFKCGGRFDTRETRCASES